MKPAGGRWTRLVAIALLVVSLAGCQPRLSGTEFKALFDRYEPLPGSVRLTQPPPITGNADADARIRSIAVGRGYRLRSQHTGNLVTVAGVPIDERVAGPFHSLIAEANRNGFHLGAKSGYRSADLQRTLFRRRIAGYSISDIIAGRADGAINAALMWVAAPGYSKHQSGFTLDLEAAGGAAFGTSAVGRWLAADNYAVPKRFGFIPSYPPGAGAQGPEPEPWEYNYVGVKAVGCALYLARQANREAFDECLVGTPISLKYASLGASSGALGPRTKGEHGLPDGRGRRAGYANGDILWSASTGAHEVRGSLLRAHDAAGGVGGPLGYPTTDTLVDGRGEARYVSFEGGRIYSSIADASTVVVRRPFLAKYDSLRGSSGVLDYPSHDQRASLDGRSTYQDFRNGRIYQLGTRLLELHGSVFRLHQAQGGPSGAYGYPVNELHPVGDGRGTTQVFDRARVWNTATTGTVGLHGRTLDRYLGNGGPAGQIGYPRTSTAPVSDGRGMVATFERGNIYALTGPGGAGHEVRSGMLTAYLAAGGPTGELGYPTTELDPPGTAGGRFQSFEHGRLQYFPDGSAEPA
ncbi:MAG: repeat protein [Acidimicrobiales bacterium]|nr:repeat protein [Acidimicrobiales bacterium]